MDKTEMLENGVELMNEFCAANPIDVPHMSVHAYDKWRLGKLACAYYRPTLISICPSRCSHVGTSGMSWSYPGYVIDRTPYGVIQHELGHHVEIGRASCRERV